MSAAVSLEHAQAHLPELVNGLAPGEEIVILRQHQPVAKLVGQPSSVRKPRKPGSAKGILVVLQEDDDHLKDF